MVKHTWKGPGVFAHLTGDILPGKPMPSDIDAETLARLVTKGVVVTGELPTAAGVADELTLAKAAHVKLVAKVEQQADELNQCKEIIDTVTAEAQAAIAGLTDELAAANGRVVTLTDELAAANKNIADLTALMTDGAGPKGGKK